MDISILLALQNFRDATETFLAPFVNWFSKMSISGWPLVFLMMYYWVANRKTGRKMLMGMSLAYFLNGLLKMTFCVYRPWIRDARIEPFGDSKVSSTGYSFPSGHTTAATSTIGNIGVAVRKEHRRIAIGCFVFVGLVMFSRMYLGVHTPQDVLVGLAHTFLMIACAYAIERWTDENPDRNDKIVIVVGLVLCLAAILFVNFKSYPMDYNADGSLLVDPIKMLPDFYEGIGMVSALVICRYFERRGFAFDEELNWKDRFIVGAICSIPVFWWENHIVNIFVALGSKCVGKYIWGAGLIVWPMIIVPLIMKKISKCLKECEQCQEQ